MVDTLNEIVIQRPGEPVMNKNVFFFEYWPFLAKSERTKTPMETFKVRSFVDHLNTLAFRGL